MWDFILHLEQYGLGTYSPVAREGEFTKDTKQRLPDEAFRCIVDRWYATDYKDFTKNSMNVEVYLDHVWSFEDLIWRLNDLGVISSPTSMKELRERYVPRKHHQVVKGSSKCLEFSGVEAVVAELKDGNSVSSGVNPEINDEVEETDWVLEGKKKKLKEIEKDARRLIEEVQESLDETTEVLDKVAGEKTVHFMSESEDSEDESENEAEDDVEDVGQEEDVVLVESCEEDIEHGNDVEKLKSKISARDKDIRKKNEYISKLQISNRTTMLSLRRTRMSGLSKRKSLVKAVNTYFENGNPSLKSMIEKLYTDNKEILSMLKSQGAGYHHPAATSGSFKRPDHSRPPAPLPRADMAPVQPSDQWSNSRRAGSGEAPSQHQQQQQWVNQHHVLTSNQTQQNARYQVKQLGQTAPVHQPAPPTRGYYSRQAYYDSGPPPVQIPAPSTFSGLSPAPSSFSGPPPNPSSFSGPSPAPSFFSGHPPAPSSFSGPPPAPSAFSGQSTPYSY